ncbi:41465_t:CDS:2 [Gigaspora margarita]|uniref:41465_t:CDS:1 n=1 Tax=Gigaspora margarita TaxID=4874 RepID=A0ABN7UD27_GIGMA|nr:41465_t:CDS:2 [Gigaspora margarita]
MTGYTSRSAARAHLPIANKHTIICGPFIAILYNNNDTFGSISSNQNVTVQVESQFDMARVLAQIEPYLQFLICSKRIQLQFINMLNK